MTYIENIESKISRRNLLKIGGLAAGGLLLEGCGTFPFGGNAEEKGQENKTSQVVEREVTRVVEKPVEKVVEKIVTQVVEKQVVVTATPKPNPTVVFEQRVEQVMRDRQANPTSVATDDAIHDEARRRLGTSAVAKPAEAPAKPAEAPAKPAEAVVPARPAAAEVVPKAIASPVVAGTPAAEVLGVKVTLVEAKVNPAESKGNNQWVLRHPDGDKTEVRQLPAGFTPDKDLVFATDLKPRVINKNLTVYKDWETAINTKREAGALAGYNYDYNDFCAVPGFNCNVQADMYAWRTFQGQEVVVPGIGKLEGGPRRSVLLNVLNLDGSVHAWDVDAHGPVKVKRGFTATGRIFDGEKNVDATEENLSGHWLFRQAHGTPEKSYIGITDSPDNAQEVLLVTVQRKQWGFEVDAQGKEKVDTQGNKTKRMQFQLVRAEIVKVK